MPRSSKEHLHRITADIRRAIDDAELNDIWDGLTPLARNEYICWITSAKLPETRTRRIERTIDQLANGKRRPCCWPGCPHR